MNANTTRSTHDIVKITLDTLAETVKGLNKTSKALLLFGRVLAEVLRLYGIDDLTQINDTRNRSLREGLLVDQVIKKLDA